MNKEELKNILADHKKWVENEGGSMANLYVANLSRADLYGAYLYGANLRGADLSMANLRGADLSMADLSMANLRWAYLYGAYLYGANLRGADLSMADLRWADLRGADLYGANLSRADLRGADLRGADLIGADLRGADLRGADLSGAVGVNFNRADSLRMMYDQPGKIRAYKLVNDKNEGPYNGGIKYIIGKTVSVSDAETNESIECGKGINIADLPWCCREWREGYKILIVEFKAKDIAAIPNGTDGKFRVHRCKVVGEKNLVELGLVKVDKNGKE